MIQPVVRLRLARHLAGPPAGEPVVLLEGLGGDMAGWRRQVASLAQAGFRVLVWDLPGNGESDDPPDGFAMRDFAGVAVDLMDDLGLVRAHVYGQSFGGLVAQHVALEHPDRVGALVLACTHAGGASVAPAPPAPAGIDPLYSARFQREHPDHVADDHAVARMQRSSAVGQARQREAKATHDTWDRLGEIRAPTLVLHGLDDYVVGVDNGRALASRIPGAELVLLEAGHLYHSERAAEADAAVIDFLRRHPL